MFLGYIPASYLWTRYLLNRRPALFPKRQTVLAAGLMAGVLPDLDLIYFYLVDHQQHLHHGYWTHLPFFWLIVIFPWLAIGWIFRSSKITFWAIIFGSNILLHMGLDTIVGIRWLYPFSQREYFLVQVLSQYNWWVLNFLLHWTFLVELALCAVGVIVWRRDRMKQLNN
jgi:inner membrane protein